MQMQHRTHRRFVTGATIYIPTLILVTLECDEADGFSLCHEKSGALTLADRSTCEVRAFHRDVQHFVAERAIERIALRSGAYKGHYLAGPPAFKIETILQLVPGLTSDLIANASVSAWVNREDPPLPQPTGCFGKNRWLTAEAKAIETAAFAAVHADDSRFFPAETVALPRPDHSHLGTPA